MLVTIFAVNTAQRRTTVCDGTCKNIYIQYTYLYCTEETVLYKTNEERKPFPGHFLIVPFKANRKTQGERVWGNGV
jgi:hypothetical protein